MLTEKNDNLRDTGKIDKLHINELEEQIHSLTHDLQLREKVIEDYEQELGIVIDGGVDQDRLRQSMNANSD